MADWKDTPHFTHSVKCTEKINLIVQQKGVDINVVDGRGMSPLYILRNRCFRVYITRYNLCAKVFRTKYLIQEVDNFIINY